MKRIFFGGARIDSVVADLGVTLVRLGVGAAMVYFHGLGKFPISEQFIEGVKALGFPAPTVFAYAAAASEVAGAGLVALGLFTRPAALMLLTTMCVAFFMQHAADPFKIKEPAFLYGTFALTFLFLGSGRFALDRIFHRRSLSG